MRAFPVVFSGVLVSAGALAFALGGGGGGGADPLEPPPPVNTEFAGVLLRVGLGAETLAAAGISAEQIPALVAELQRNYTAAATASRDEAFITAKQTHDRLRRLVTSGKGTRDDVVTLRAAEATLAAATTQRENHLAGLRAAALATVSEGQRALVNKIRANESWRLPVQYLAKDRSEAQWVELRDLLAAQRIHAEDGEAPFPAEAQGRLAAIDAESEIATAKVNRDAGIAAVQSAWNAAAD